jgi:hypothetical protein
VVSTTEEILGVSLAPTAFLFNTEEDKTESETPMGSATFLEIAVVSISPSSQNEESEPVCSSSTDDVDETSTASSNVSS